MTLQHAVRWALVPVSAMAACAGTLTSADVVGHVSRQTFSLASVEAVFPFDVRAGIIYAIAAALFIIAGAAMAPGYRIAVSVLLYLLGARLAWEGLRGWYFPEGHPLGYQRSLVPLSLTLAGGIIGLIAVVAWCTARFKGVFKAGGLT